MLKFIKHIGLYVVMLLLLLLNTQEGYAQGETCATAISVSSLPFNETGNTSGKGDDYDETDACSSSYMKGDDIVYTYTPSEDKLVTIKLTNTGSWVGVFLFDGCPDAGATCVDMDGSSLGDPSIDNVTLTGGTTYYIVISTWASPQSTPYTIDISACDGVGSSCSNAHSIGAIPFSDSNTSCGACSIYSSSDACGSTYMNGQEYVYEYIPSSNEDILVSLSGTNGGSGVYVIKDCPDVGTCVAYDVDYYGDPDLVSASLVAGEIYYFVVGFTSTQDCDAFSLNIIKNDPPPACGDNPLADNTCDNATPICNLDGFCGNTSDDYTVDNMSGNLDSEFCGSIDNNSWLSFTASSTSTILIVGVDNCSYASGVQMQVYESADCNTFVGKSTCFNPGSAVGGTVVATGLTAGTKYYLMIDGYGGDNCDYVIGAGSGVELPITATDTSICSGQTVSLKAINGSGTYQWNTNPVSNTDSIVVSPTVNTDYIVTSVGANPDCETNDTASVTILPSPSSIISGSSAVCDGNDATFDVNLTGVAPWSIDITNTTTNNTTTVNSINSSPYVATVNDAGTYEISLVTDQGCTGTNSGNVFITVNTTPLAPTAASPSSYCAGETILDLTATGAGGTLNWYTESTLDNLVGTGTSFSSGVDNSATGSTSFWVVEDNNSCISPATQVTITVVAAPSTPSVSAPSDYCIGQTISAITATGSGGVIKWYSDVSLSALEHTGATVTPSIDNSSVGSQTYWITETSNGCISSATSVTINVTGTPSGPSAIGGTYCLNESINDLTVSGNPGSTFTWYSDASLLNQIGTGVSYSSGIDNTVNSENFYYVTETNNGCISAASTVSVIILDPPPTPVASSPSDYCIGETIADLSAIGTFWTLKWYSDSDLTNEVGTGNTLSSGVDNSVAGTTSFYVVEDSGSCISSAQQVDIVIKGLVVAPVGSSPAAICEGDNLSDLTVSANGTITWYSESGLINVIATGTSYTPTIDNNTGTTSYYVTNEVDGCVSSTLQLDVVINSMPVAPTALSPSTYCLNDAVADLIVSGVGSTFTWYSDVDLTNVVGSGVNFSTGINNTVLDTISYWVTQSVGTCVSTASQVVVGFQVTDDASFSYESASYCKTGTDPVATINGLAGGLFTATPSGLIFLDDNTGEIDLGNSSLGDYTITYTTNGPCPNQEEIALKIVASVDADFSYPKASYCDSEGNPLPTGNDFGIFSSTPSGISFVNANTGEIDLSNSDEGVYSVQNLIGSQSGCLPDSHFVNITIVSPDLPKTAAVPDYCAGDQINDIAATAMGGGSLSWYNDVILANLIGTGATYSPVSIDNNSTGTIEFYVTETSGGCESIAQKVSIVIKQTPQKPLVLTPEPYCSGEAINDIIATASSGGSLNWFDDVDLLNNIQSGTTLSSGLDNEVAGSFNFYVHETFNGCTSDTSKVTILINPTPEKPSGKRPNPYCEGDNLGTINVSGSGGTLIWYDDENLLNIVNTGTNYNPSVDMSNAAIYEYYLTETIGNCVSDTNTIVLEIREAPNAPNMLAFDSYCTGDNIALLSVSGTVGFVNWYDDAILTQKIGFGKTHDAGIDNSIAGTYRFYVTETLGSCVSESSMVSVEIFEIPSVPEVVPAFVYCQGATIESIISSGTTGKVNWYDDQYILLDSGSIFDPTIDVNSIGVFEFYLNSTENKCTSDVTAFQVTIIESPTIPFVNSMQYCEGDLVSPLSASSSVGGSGSQIHWFDDAFLSNHLNTGNTFNSNSVGDTSFWVVDSISTCSSAPVEISIEIFNQELIGEDTVKSYYCDSENSIDLLDELDDASNKNGVWFDMDNNAFDGSFDPSKGNSSIFYYVLESASICPNDTAMIFTYVENAPNAGFDSEVHLCETDEPIDLIDQLTVLDLNGIWTNESGDIISSIIIPGTDESGDYTYTLEGESICSDDYSIVTVLINAKPEVNFKSDKLTICEGDYVVFESLIEYPEGTVFDWSFGNNEISDKENPLAVRYRSSGEYDVSLIINTALGDPGSCASRLDSALMIKVAPMPEAEFDMDKTEITLLEGPIQFTNLTFSENELEYLWDFGDNNSSNEISPSHQYDEAGYFTITLIVSDSFSCADTAFGEVILEPDFTVFMPNAFSPNGDDVNDTFKPVGLADGIQSYLIEVWARNGTLVYSSRDFKEGWDGIDPETGLPHLGGLFSYTVQITDFKGNMLPVIKGQVILMY